MVISELLWCILPTEKKNIQMSEAIRSSYLEHPRHRFEMLLLQTAKYSSFSCQFLSDALKGKKVLEIISVTFTKSCFSINFF